MADYIPAQDAQFNNWFSNFVTYAGLNAAALGLSPTETNDLLSAQGDFDTALSSHLTAQAAAHAATTAKDQTRLTAEELIRKLVKKIQGNPAVTDEQRQNLGITVPKSGKTPVPVPASRPVAEVERTQGFRQSLRLVDSHSNRPAKPYGIVGAEVWMKIVPPGATPPADPAEMTLVGIVPNTRITQEFNGADAGKTASYFFRWVNTRGEKGPWSTQVNATIAA